MSLLNIDIYFLLCYDKMNEKSFIPSPVKTVILSNVTGEG